MQTALSPTISFFMGNGQSSSAGESKRFDSWKEIASYLRRGIRTVQRWEQEEGLPVHRLPHQKRGSVYAWKHELDQWWEQRGSLLEEAPESADAKTQEVREATAPADSLSEVTNDEEGPLRQPGAAPSRNPASRFSLRGNPWIFAPWLVAAAALLGMLVLISQREAAPQPFARMVPFATGAANERWPAWSPDGRSIAYTADVDGINQVLVRKLDAPVATQVTHSATHCVFPFWSPDGARLFFNCNDEIWFAGIAGGEPQKLISGALWKGAMHPSGNAIAFLRSETEARGTLLSVWISSPPGAEPRRYSEPPFNAGHIRLAFPAFSPDRSSLGVLMFLWEGRWEFWSLPYPSGRPQRLLERSLSKQAIMTWPGNFAWFPDGRHIVLDRIYPGVPGQHLYFADIRTDSIFPLTTVRQGRETDASVSPDGHRLIYTAEETDSDIVEIAVDGSTVRDVLATPLGEDHPAFTPDGDSYTFVTGRSGAPEIWLKSRHADWERPLVTQKDFGEDITNVLIAPAVSPDGQRLAFVRQRQYAYLDVWVTPMAGGVPVRLASTPAGLALRSPSWSPDGNWISVLYSLGGRLSLAKVKVGSTAGPIVLKQDTGALAPRWSPKGDRIGFQAAEGLAVISPDGGQFRVLTKTAPLMFAWLKDGSSMVAVQRVTGRPGRYRIVSIDAGDGKEKALGEFELPHHTSLPEGATMSLAPDGKTFLTARARSQTDLWMLDGLKVETSLLERLGLRRP